MGESVVQYATRQAASLAIAGLSLIIVLVLSSITGVPRAGADVAPIAGPARAIDGDTLIVGEQRIRLEGIDAPESGQTCGRKWVGTWACGSAATEHLAKLIESGPVRCVSKGQDRYGRTLGVCYAGEVEINADLVRRGLAWAFLKYSQSYVEAEDEARALRAGIWQGDAVPAWEYRRILWDKSDDAAPNGCAIKGNVTRGGQIYHMPWSPWYGQIRMDGDKGKRWFCTEAEAQAAGWRPAMTR